MASAASNPHSPITNSTTDIATTTTAIIVIFWFGQPTFLELLQIKPETQK